MGTNTKVLWNLITLLAVLSVPKIADAAKGVVLFYKSGCDYYIVATDNGYALLEWYGGNDPSEGDILLGAYESYGMKHVYNLSADSETQVWVEDYWLNEGRVVEKYYDKCN